MLRNLKKFLLSTSAFVLTFIALSGVSTMCMWKFYEPHAPKSLKRDL